MKVGAVLKDALAEMNLTLIDFKIEIVYDNDGKMYVVDEIIPDIWCVKDAAGNIPNQIDCTQLISEKIQQAKAERHHRCLTFFNHPQYQALSSYTSNLYPKRYILDMFALGKVYCIEDLNNFSKMQKVGNAIEKTNEKNDCPNSDYSFSYFLFYILHVAGAG